MTEDESGNQHFKKGKLNMVDLAGSERQKRTGATGDRLDEAKSINLSLSALGNVIKALVDNKSKHVPFRDSKLTRLLQDSLGGNTKTCMLAALGPAHESFDETLSTLRYANRAKNIKNKPKINEDPKDAMLREMQDEIQKLRELLAKKKGGLDVLSQLGELGVAAGGEGVVEYEEGEKIFEEKIVEQVEVVETGISEEDLKELQQKLDLEVKEMTFKTQGEKDKYMKERKEVEKKAMQKKKALEKQQQRIEREKAEVERIQTQLRSVENGIQEGTKDVEEARETEKEFERLQMQIAEQAQDEEAAIRDLEAAEEAEIYMEESYANAQMELEQKSKKLKKLWIKYTEKKEYIDDLQEEFALERDDLIDTIRALDRQIKLKNLVTDAFVPPKYIELVENNALWDSVNNRWVLGGLNYTCNNIQRHDQRMDYNPDNYASFVGDEGMMAMNSGEFNHGMATSEMEARFRNAMQNPSEPPSKATFFSYGTSKKKKKNKD